MLVLGRRDRLGLLVGLTQPKPVMPSDPNYHTCIQSLKIYGLTSKIFYKKDRIVRYLKKNSTSITF